jgi:hypothetical protein
MAPRRRMAFAMLLTAVLTSLLASPVAGTEPTRPVATRPTLAERPLTDAEQAASDRKVASALAYVADQQAADAQLLPLSCLTPNGSVDGGTTDAACISIPQYYLGVQARDQIRSHYCGPAVGQVISNYAWNTGSGNKYTQTQIAQWMQTDIRGQTSAPELEDGLELATARAPRRPANWDWVITEVRDLNRNGSSGDELHAFVRTNVSGSKMPLAIPVKPHDANSLYNLSSWPRPVGSVGHWIAAYGWYGNWIGGDFARTYYTDSSRDEGGATGYFWNATRHLAGMIREHTGRLVW